MSRLAFGLLAAGAGVVAGLSFATRLFSGAFSGAVMAANAPNSNLIGILCGALGAAVGTLGPDGARVKLSTSFRLSEAAFGIPEGLVTAGGGLLLLWLFPR